jgi:hypothetical protein
LERGRRGGGATPAPAGHHWFHRRGNRAHRCRYGERGRRASRHRQPRGAATASAARDDHDDCPGRVASAAAAGTAATRRRDEAAANPREYDDDHDDNDRRPVEHDHIDRGDNDDAAANRDNVVKLTRRRIATGAAACALVVGGLVILALRGDESDRVNLAVSGDAETTTTVPLTTTSKTVPPFVTTAPTAVDATAPGVPVAEAQPDDFTGAITLSKTTVEVDESVDFALTLRNVSGHAVRLTDEDTSIGVCTPAGFFYYPCRPVHGPGDPPFAVDEERTYSGSLGMGREFIGPVDVKAGFLHGQRVSTIFRRALPGVPVAPLVVTPPDWHPGQPLDPTQARWRAQMSSDSTQVADDGTVRVQAHIRNLADDVATTRGYGSLAIMCQTAREGTATLVDHVIDTARLTPGASAVFSAEFDLEDAQAHGVWYAPSLSRIQCSLGMKFDEQDDPYNLPAWTHPVIESDTVVIRVTHPTSKTAPEGA